MLAYRAHPALTRDVILAEVAAHTEADRYITGTYWDNDTQRGCAVGCTLHSAARLTGLHVDPADHGAFVDLLGMPEVIARLQDIIFEHLPNADRRKWPGQFYTSIADGADLSGVTDRILVRILREVALPVAANSAAIVKRVAAGIETRWAHDDRDAAEGAARAAAAWAAWAAAYYAARAGAWAAEGAAWVATSAARAATSAARAATSAARAARAATWVAAYAAASDAAEAAEADARAAEADAWTRIAAIVLGELRAAPVPANGGV